MAGDLAQNYKTIPIIYGAGVSKSIITSLIVLTLVPALLLIKSFDVGYMHYYFMACVALLILFLILLWKAEGKRHYVWLHNIIKFIIVVGVFSILLIDVDVISATLGSSNQEKKDL